MSEESEAEQDCRAEQQNRKVEQKVDTAERDGIMGWQNKMVKCEGRTAQPNWTADQDDRMGR